MSILQELTSFGSSVAQLIDGLQCPVDFPVPAPDDILPVLQLPQCLPAFQLNPVGELNPEFIGLTPEELAAITDLNDLPTFTDLYEPPQPGPFETSIIKVGLSLHLLLTGLV